MRRLALLEAKEKQAQRGGLIEFVRYFWNILEPETELVEGWPLEVVCQHLEAVTFGEVNRLLINVPPGFMKSLLTNVFWPAWEWGPMNMPHLRYVTFSYAASLTERDNGRFRDLVRSPEYQALWGDKFSLMKIGETKVSNSKTGWKLSSSIGGVATGERGNRILLDDPHSVKEAESEVVRTETVRWFRESMSNRLNDIETDAIVIIMQRVHEADVSGTILEGGFEYCHLMIPMEYDGGRSGNGNDIGWIDPREEDGELAWPERFPERSVERLKVEIGPYAYAGQYQQSPAPRGGAIFRRDWWQLWESPDGKFPPFDYVIASLDGAFTEKQENDPSALTVWGLWREEKTIQQPNGSLLTNKDGPARLMLLDAWRKHLSMHGTRIEYSPDELAEMHSGDPERRKFGERHYNNRTKPHWGLVEWVAYTCKRWRVDRLLIEAKASGITAAQELQRLYGDEQWTVQLEQVTGDKVARAMAVVPTFSQLLVYAPDRDWADLVIGEMEQFPKGRYDDLTDSATQAIKHLRSVGLIQHPDEHQADVLRRMKHRPKNQPLYPT